MFLIIRPDILKKRCKIPQNFLSVQLESFVITYIRQKVYGITINIIPYTFI